MVPHLALPLSLASLLLLFSPAYPQLLRAASSSSTHCPAAHVRPSHLVPLPKAAISFPFPPHLPPHPADSFRLSFPSLPLLTLHLKKHHVTLVLLGSPAPLTPCHHLTYCPSGPCALRTECQAHNFFLSLPVPAIPPVTAVHVGISLTPLLQRPQPPTAMFTPWALSSFETAPPAELEFRYLSP